MSTESTTESSSINPTVRKAVFIGIAIVAVIIIGVLLYRNRKRDSLDGFWATKGAEHYVAYVHGDTIDIFWFSDLSETVLDDMTPGRRMSGHFTPPAPGFRSYAFDLTYDYDRTNARLVSFGTWKAAERADFESNPFTFRFEYKDGKLIRYYDDGSTDVFYPSSKAHREVDMEASIYDMQHEISQLAFPLKVGAITEVPVTSADSTLESLVFVEVTNSNIFRINTPSLLFYNDPADTGYSECKFGGYLDAASHVVLVAGKLPGVNINTQHRDLVYNEYGIDIIDYQSEPPVKNAGSTFNDDSVTVNVHTDVAPTTPQVHQIAVVFYHGGEIVGGGYEYFTLDSNDATVTVPIMTDLTDYDYYDVFIY